MPLALQPSSAAAASRPSRVGTPSTAGACQQVAAHEQQPRVDVPRHADGAGRRCGWSARCRRSSRPRTIGGASTQHRVQRLDRAQRGHLGQPGVADLRDVGRGVAGECRQQLFVRRVHGSCSMRTWTPGFSARNRAAARPRPRPRGPWPRSGSCGRRRVNSRRRCLRRSPRRQRASGAACKGAAVSSPHRADRSTEPAPGEPGAAQPADKIQF